MFEAGRGGRELKTRLHNPEPKGHGINDETKPKQQQKRIAMPSNQAKLPQNPEMKTMSRDRTQMILLSNKVRARQMFIFGLVVTNNILLT